MKVRIIGPLLVLMAFIHFGRMAEASQQEEPSEWQALRASLRGAKSIVAQNGFVPDESTAVKVAEAIAIAQYGEKEVSKEEPFRARLYGNTWIVKGTLHPKGALGGTIVVKIDKKNGTVLFLTHQE